MLKSQFDSLEAIMTYIEEQKIRQKNGSLTCSERAQLKQLSENPKNYIKIEPEISPNVKSIITNINLLSVPCVEVLPTDSITQIVTELKETLSASGGVGLSANQIGYNKKISYIRIPKFDKKHEKVTFSEIVLINAKIVEKDRKIRINGEGCLSFPGVRVDTERYVFITLVNCNEKLEPNTLCLQDLEAIAVQHELDHTLGLTLFNRKYKAK